MTDLSQYKGQFMVIVGNAMKTLLPRIQSKYPWIVGHYYIGSFDGSPDDMWVYFSHDTREHRITLLTDAVQADVRAMTLDGLRCEGYPERSFASLKIEWPTKEEIDKAGGWYNYLR